ncbi:MAG: tRNA pseudouridine(55) synthase TruB [Armatimonadetes bacterium]|nr:MAG: tRNA pseudouridine(55) synthase TruB [Armatimonadota bacterium]
MTDLPPGFLLIDKDQGWTSHDVVAKVRNAVGGKVGHAGTLDPMATGLLVLAVGGATRLLRFVQSAEKEYVATALFGVATDSLDADGSILSREPLPVSVEDVEAALERFRGDILQMPPMVSARKVEGKRLYELAREGKVVERESRPVTIHSLELVDIAPSDYPEVTLRTVCSTGTYIRTLADDIARALGGRAHLTALRRIRNGSMRVEDAMTIDEVVSAAADGTIGELVVEASSALDHLPELPVSDATAFRVRNGVVLHVGDVGGDSVTDLVRVTDGTDALIAVYRRVEQQLRPEVVLG